MVGMSSQAFQAVLDDSEEGSVASTHSTASQTYSQVYMRDEYEDEHEVEESVEEEVEVAPNWTIDINKLPREMLCDILEIASAGAENAVSFVFRASLVCRYWKEVAFAAPKLWGRLDAEKSLEVTRSLLKRSKRAPLDIWIYLNPQISEGEGISQIQSFATLVSPERPRFNRFTFHFYYPSWFEAGSSLLTSEPTVVVDSLDVRRLEYCNPRTQSEKPTVGLGQTTLIPRHLRYDDISALPPTFAKAPMFSRSLQSLDIGWTDYRTPIDSFLLMISGAENLEYLRIATFSTFIAPPGGASAHGRYPLPSLREMVLENVSLRQIPTLSSLIATPMLERLLIDTLGAAEPPDSILAIIEQNSQLQRLHLSSYHLFDPVAWAQVLLKLPELTHLQLSNSWHDDDAEHVFACLVANPSSPESALCPRLQSITFDNVEGIQDYVVMELVKSRRDIVGVSPIKDLSWNLISPGSLSEIYEEIGTIVPNLTLEGIDMAVLREPSESSEPSEEWSSDDGDPDLDSGDEEVIRMRGRPWSAS